MISPPTPPSTPPTTPSSMPRSPSPVAVRPALQTLPRRLRDGSLLAGAMLLATFILTVLVAAYLITHALIFPRPALEVSMTSDTTTIHPMDTVRLRVTRVAGRELTYRWTLGDGSSGSGPLVTHQYATYGYYAVTVTASDPTGQIARAQLVVTVLPDEPVAAAKLVSADSGGAVTLDAGSSTGASPQYDWGFGDGSPSVFSLQPQVTHTYAHPGVYNVTLTVIDAAGQTSTTQLQVQVG